MPSKIQKLVNKKLITPPLWLPDNVQYETIMGSNAYGITVEDSDLDIYGWCIPPKGCIFPHTVGIIDGFTKGRIEFNHYQQHQIEDKEARRKYDITVYSVVKYFRMLADGNPNINDSLYTDLDCVLHCTNSAQLVRENRKIFLSKRMWPRYKQYAFSQLKKIDSLERTGKRVSIIEKYGWDVKFGYHLLRLLDEIEQILMYEDIDLRRNNEQLKAIRRGELGKDDVKQLAKEKERHLEQLFFKSKLQDDPDEVKIQQLLLDILESHYGNLSDVIIKPDRATNALKQILEIAQKELI